MEISPEFMMFSRRDFTLGATASVASALVTRGLSATQIFPSAQAVIPNAAAVAAPHDRWSDTVDVMDYGADPTGATANFHTVLTTAIAEAKSRKRSTVRVPRGFFTHSSPITFAGTDPVRIVGEGPRITYIMPTYASGDGWKIGETAATRTTHLRLEEVTLQPSQVVQTSGAAIRLRNAEGIRLFRVAFGLWRQALIVGDGTSADNDVVGLTLDYCEGAANANSTDLGFIELHSGGSLVVRGESDGNWQGGTLAQFISQVDVTRNWDGLAVQEIAGRDFRRYVSSHASGIAALRFSDSIIDGADIFFFGSGVNATTQNKDWIIAGNHIQGGGVGCLWQKGTGANPIALVITNNVFQSQKQHCLQSGADTDVMFNGNAMTSPGTAGTSAIRFGGTGAICGNTASKRNPADGTYTHAISWENGPLARIAEGNLWRDYLTDEESGTR